MKLCQLSFLLQCVLLGCVSLISFAFTPCTWRKPAQRWNLKTSSEAKSSTALELSSSSSEIFLLSFDGTVAATTEWRMSQGIDLAFSVWPRLREMSVIAEDDEWLRNKMRAVSSVLVSRPGCSLSVDYALLARLLIEEQELDQGRSNGCGGKYGSKFHPQSQSSSSSSRGGQRGSRPLTVGEIAENWNKGGCLADTVLTKYHIDYESPLPILQEKVDELNEDGHNFPEVSHVVLDALEHSSGNIIVTVGHESDLAAAQKAIESIGMSTTVLSSGEESLSESLNSNNDNSIMLLSVPTTHGATYKDVLKNAPFGATVFVFESSWPALEQGIYLFGDNIPRGGSGMAQTVLGRDLHLSLNFPKWSTTKTQGSQSKSQGDVAQQNEAMMNPWTNLVAARDFSELLSARIIPSVI